MANQRKRRRSSKIERGSIRGTVLAAGAVGALVIGGGLWLGGSEEPWSRDQYASKEDCQADWGGDSATCEQTGGVPSGGGSGATSGATSGVSPEITSGVTSEDSTSSSLTSSGNSAGHSSTTSNFSSGGGIRPLWFGPSYPMHDRDGALRQAWLGRSPSAGFAPGNRSIGRTAVSRGGFGSSSQSSSSHSSSSS